MMDLEQTMPAVLIMVLGREFTKAYDPIAVWPLGQNRLLPESPATIVALDSRLSDCDEDPVLAEKSLEDHSVASRYVGLACYDPYDYEP